MTFRSRLTVSFLLAVLIPMIALTLFIRNEMTSRMTAQYGQRVESLISVIEEDLDRHSASVRESLALLSEVVVDDNRFRRAAVDRSPEERRYLLNYAGNAMQLTGLSMLQIQDEQGRIISSGHFRNEYDRMEPELPRLLSFIRDNMALVRARSPGEPFLVMACLDSFTMSGKHFFVTGGIRIASPMLRRLARDREVEVTLTYPGGVISSRDMETGENRDQHISGSDTPAGSRAVIRELEVPFINTGAGEISPASFRVTHHLSALSSLLGGIDRWFLIVVAVAGVAAVSLVGWLASRISRPLERLAAKTARLDLDNLDVDFSTGREDEIGKLAGVLNTMTERLRLSAARIKDAERRATLGEMARQVNHDIKNGLAPLRNIFRHLSQLARDDRGELGETFRRRQESLEGSITYLEDLASKYAGLSPRTERRPFEINRIIRRSVGDARSAGNVELTMNLCGEAVVKGDPLSLQRVIENLVRNARDSLESGPGEITVSTRIIKNEGENPLVRITVSDTGRGMSEEEKARIFNHFYTTREKGTGLGLSIVQRLVRDLGGFIRVESAAGEGTSFIIDLPLEEDEGR